MAQRAGRRRLRRRTTRRPAATRCPPSRPSRSPSRTARRSCPASSRSRSAPCTAPTTSSRRPARGDRRRLARARRRRPRRLRAVLPARLQRAPRRRVAAGARRRRRQAGGGRHRRRRRLRPRRVDRPDGAGVPDARRFVGSDYHAGVDRDRPRARRRRPASPTACASRSPPAPTFSGEGYDLVTMFDCLHDMGDPVGAARHVRETLAAGRHLDDRRADGRRPRRGQLQPGRARLLRLLDAALHAGVARRRTSGSALGTQAGPARIRDVTDGGRLHPLPHRRRDAVQPGLRGPAVTRRVAVVGFGGGAYLAFLASFTYLIGFVGGIGVPKGIDDGGDGPDRARRRRRPRPGEPSSRCSTA